MRTDTLRRMARVAARDDAPPAPARRLSGHTLRDLDALLDSAPWGGREWEEAAAEVTYRHEWARTIDAALLKAKGTAR